MSIMLKAENSRMNAQVHQITLDAYDFSQTAAKVLLKPLDADSDACQNTQEDTVVFDFSGLAFEFNFDHWFEVQSSSIESEQGIGTFTIKEANLRVELKPYISAERLRLAIQRFEFEFNDHSLQLNRPQKSDVSSAVFEQFAGIYLEHGRKKIEDELPLKLAVRVQQALHQYLIVFQKNAQLKGGDIFMNKNTVDFCMTRTNFVLMVRGDFYVSSGSNLLLIGENSAPGLKRDDIAKPEIEPYFVLSRGAFQSLVDSALIPQSNMFLQWRSQFKVSELEDLIEGFANAFDEDLQVEVESHVLKVQELAFDDTFGNIAFKLMQQHAFKNPIEPRFLSASVTTAQQGVLDLQISEKLDFYFKVEQKQERVKDFEAFFKSETTKDEFREEWSSNYSKKILQGFNEQLASGVRIPFGHT